MNCGEGVGEFVRKKISTLDKKLKKEDSWARGMLAKLRRGVGRPPGSVPDIWEITMEWDDAIGVKPKDWEGYDKNPSRSEIVVHLALTLYAMHRQGKSDSMSLFANERVNQVSFGSAMAKLWGKEKEEGVRKRFNAVATAGSFEELTRHIRGIVQLLRAKDIKLDYARFAKDMYACLSNDGTSLSNNGVSGVLLGWGRDFYRNNNDDVDLENN